MFQVVAIDPSLITSNDQGLQFSVWNWMRMSGWNIGRLIADTPALGKQLRFLPPVAGKRYSALLELMKEKKKCIQVPIGEGRDWFERVDNAPVISKILVQDTAGSNQPGKTIEFKDDLEIDNLIECQYQNDDLLFLRACETIIYASSITTIVDRYILSSFFEHRDCPPIPLFKYLIDSDEFPLMARGEKRKIIINTTIGAKGSFPVLEKLIDAPDTNSHDLLVAMGSEKLSEKFDIIFRIWGYHYKHIHPRYLFGNGYVLFMDNGLYRKPVWLFGKEGNPPITVARLSNQDQISVNYEPDGRTAPDFLGEIRP